MYQMPGSSILPYRGKYPKVADGVFLAAGSHLIGDVIVGKDSSFWFNTVTRGDCYYIRIGERSNIQDGTVVHVTNSRFATTIGDDVTVGHNATLHGCTIGSGSLIGMGATIMDGAEIGERCIVAAGALVPPGKSFPAESLIIGNPAKKSRDVTPKELEFLKTSVAYYLEYKSHYVPYSE